MKSLLRKSTVREIKESFGRFFAIFAIIALGVGFFSGVKITKQTMVNTINQYLKEKNFFDFHLLSTIGFEEEDIEIFSEEKDVRYAEGVYTFDALYTGIGNNEIVLKTYSMPEHINGIRIVSGRLPESASECVLDAELNMPIELGSVISLTDNNDEDTLDSFKVRKYTVVGTVDSSYYLNFERGTTSIGTGKAEGFVYVLPEAFSCEYYTDAFICFEQDYDIYSQEYQEYIDDKEDEWEEICKSRINTRYNNLRDDAQKELNEAKLELEDNKEEGEENLSDAYTELLDAENQVNEGRTSLNTAWTTYYNQEEELAVQEEQLTAKEQEISQQESDLQTAMQQIPQEQQSFFTSMLQTYQQAGIEERKSLQEQWGMMPELQPFLSLILGSVQLEEGKNTLEEARFQLEEGKKQLSEGRAELIKQEQEWENAKAEVEDGWQDYEESKAEFQKKIGEAEEEIEDAQKKVDALKEPDTYVLGRETNVGYVCFESDSDIVEAVARVFPVFFILVAALVCMTTMNRMVEEQRIQIGVLKALGYSESDIMGKFMFYAGSAALLGCVMGYMAGTIVFPKVIWTAYSLMYQQHALKYVFNWKLALIAILVSLLCSIGTTWLSCRYELKENAAGLMRGKAPKAGKRVFLEHIPFIWKRLKFLHKVSIRNLLRYKKRFFMMVIGISGCTALLLTGFGIKDSIAGFAEQQYEEIQILDGTIELKESLGKDKRKELEDSLTKVAEESMYVSESSWNLVTENAVENVSMVIPEAADTIESFIQLKTVTGNPIPFPSENEAVINSNLADSYQIDVGDEIVLRNESMQELRVTVSGIFNNHVYNYVFLSPKTYEQQLGESPEYKTIYVNYKSDIDAHQAAAELMQEEQVISTEIFEDTKVRLTTMMSSLNYVVLLIIICAAGLAFIVMYNLTNINITERVREIATIKVLGFYPKETASYVFRENVALTAIGTLLGLILGVFLHRFVMSQIHVDMVSFDIRILPLSYVYSIVLTFAFNCFVNIVMTGKLEKINMAESLKSVD